MPFPAKKLEYLAFGELRRVRCASPRGEEDQETVEDFNQQTRRHMKLKKEPRKLPPFPPTQPCLS